MRIFPTICVHMWSVAYVSFQSARRIAGQHADASEMAAAGGCVIVPSWWFERGLSCVQFVISDTLLQREEDIRLPIVRRERARLQLGVPQTQRIGDHGDGAEAHGGGGEDRAEEDAEERVQNAGCDGHSERVVDEGEEKILADVAHCGLAEAAGAEDSGEISFDQRDAA